MAAMTTFPRPARRLSRQRPCADGSGSRARRPSPPALPSMAGSVGRGSWCCRSCSSPTCRRSATCVVRVSGLHLQRRPQLGARAWRPRSGRRDRQRRPRDRRRRPRRPRRHGPRSRLRPEAIDLLPRHPPRPHGPREVGTPNCLAARQPGAAQGGAEHVSERTPRCVSEEHRRQRGDVPAWRVA